MHFPRFFGLFSRQRRGPLAALALAAVAGATLLTGCGVSGASGPLLAAQINGNGVALSDYQGMLKLYEAENAQQLAQSGGQQGSVSDWQSPNGRAGLASIQQSALDFLINLNLLHEQAAAHHVTVPQSDLNKVASQLDGQIQSLAKQQKSDPATAAVVAALTPRVRQLLVEQNVYQSALIARGNVKVPAAHVRAILRNTCGEAQKLETQAQQGADFGQLAKANSLDTQSAANGGDIGTFTVGQLGTQFDTAVFGTKSPAKYVVMPVNGQCALFEVTQRTTQPLTASNNAQTEQTVLSAWLTSVVQPQAQVQTFVTVQ